MVARASRHLLVEAGLARVERLDRALDLAQLTFTALRLFALSTAFGPGGELIVVAAATTAAAACDRLALVCLGALLQILRDAARQVADATRSVECVDLIAHALHEVAVVANHD